MTGWWPPGPAISLTRLPDDLELVPVAMLVVDGRGQALFANSGWMDLTGLGENETLGQGWLEVLETDSRNGLREAAASVSLLGGTVSSDHELVLQSGKRWTRWWLTRRHAAGGEAVVMAIADIHADHDARQSLYYRATHDQLTGLLNRSHFLETVDRALLRNQRSGRQVGVLYIDLDGFKLVNDSPGGGHPLGDRVLATIAGRLRNAVRAADVVARLGGDEFAVLCEDLANADELEAVAARVSRAARSTVEVHSGPLEVTASVGIASTLDWSGTAEELLARADGSMFEAKKARRNVEPILVAAPVVGPTAGPDSSLLEMIVDIRDGIEGIRALLERLVGNDTRMIDVRAPAPR